MIPLMIMLITADIFPVAIEIALNTIIIIDKMTVIIQAQLRPFSRPYATTNEATAIARSTAPIAMPIPPSRNGEMLLTLAGGTGGGACPVVRLPCS